MVKFTCVESSSCIAFPKGELYGAFPRLSTAAVHPNLRGMTKFFILLLASVCLVRAADDYTLGPDSQRQEGVPQGTITTNIWKSKIFEGTIRDYYVYVPKQYAPDKPACVMVFQDGHAYLNPEGQIRAPIVFDNLIHKGEIPVMIGSPETDSPL